MRVYVCVFVCVCVLGSSLPEETQSTAAKHLIIKRFHNALSHPVAAIQPASQLANSIDLEREEERRKAHEQPPPSIKQPCRRKTKTMVPAGTVQRCPK
uniref:Secreted peptide n=1 Tax=Anopheles braziliensis TaxID=58242 RepID=A0A2M3ZLB2_9DIPT